VAENDVQRLWEEHESAATSRSLQVLRGCRGHEFRAFAGLTPTRYVEVRRRFLREHAGHALDGWPLPAD
jgi:hypothetical protein